MSNLEKKPSFWNGWDLKSIIIVAGLLVNIGVQMNKFDNLEKNMIEMKESAKGLWQKIGTLSDEVKKQEGINNSQQRDIDKHDKKLYPN